MTLEFPSLFQNEKLILIYFVNWSYIKILGGERGVEAAL